MRNFVNMQISERMRLFIIIFFNKLDSFLYIIEWTGFFLQEFNMFYKCSLCKKWLLIMLLKIKLFAAEYLFEIFLLIICYLIGRILNKKFLFLFHLLRLYKLEFIFCWIFNINIFLKKFIKWYNVNKPDLFLQGWTKWKRDKYKSKECNYDMFINEYQADFLGQLSILVIGIFDESKIYKYNLNFCLHSKSSSRM